MAYLYAAVSERARHGEVKADVGLSPRQIPALLRQQVEPHDFFSFALSRSLLPPLSLSANDSLHDLFGLARSIE